MSIFPLWICVCMRTVCACNHVHLFVRVYVHTRIYIHTWPTVRVYMRVRMCIHAWLRSTKPLVKWKMKHVRMPIPRTHAWKYELEALQYVQDVHSYTCAYLNNICVLYTYIHTYIHAHTHTHAQTHMLTYTHIDIHTSWGIHICVHVCIIYASTHIIYTHTQTCRVRSWRRKISA